MRFTPRRIMGSMLLLATGLGIGLGARAHAGPSRELTRLVQRGGTGFDARLSLLSEPPSTTRGVPPRAVAVLVRRLRARAEAGDARAIHLRAVADLVWGPRGSVPAVDRVIEALHTVGRLQGPSAAVWSDLAAAHMVRAERAHTPRDLVLAIQFADQAATLDPGNGAAAYNRALALDRLHLRAQAAAAWRAVIALDPAARAAGEARVRLEALNGRASVRPDADAPASVLAAFARDNPQRARLWATDTVLPAWGTAVTRGDAPAATAALRTLEGLASGFAAPGRDGTVTAALNDVRRLERDPAGRFRLARAWARYGRAARVLAERRGAPAAAAFDSVRADAGASPALRNWAEYGYGVALFYSEDSTGAVREFRRLAGTVDASRFPALAGRTQWSLGTLASRRGDLHAAPTFFREAILLFRRAGEQENLGAMQAMHAESLFSLGEEAAAYAAALEALATLRPFARSTPRHNLLFALGHYTRAEGLDQGALRFQAEDVAAIEGLAAGIRAEGMLSLSRSLAAAGRFAQAADALRAGAALIDSVPDARQQGWLRADARISRAALDVRGAPHRAVAAMDSVIADARGLGSVERLLIALTQRADARVAAGDAVGAAADLDSAAATVARLSTGITSASLRASMLDARRRIFDRLSLLYAGRGLPRQALAALEQSRAPASGSRAGAGSLRSPAGEAAVEYALIGDTLLAFAVVDTAVRLERATVDGAAVRRMAEAARTRLELRLADDSTAVLLAGLYDVLVRPVQRHVGGHERLTLVVDGELGGVPFAALRDRVRGRYLVQDHVLRLAPGLGAHASAPARGRPGGRAVFVADPAFPSGEHPALPRLPNLVPETRALAEAYPGSVLLAGRSATPETLGSALGSAALFHFAGHAVFDDARPSRSFLVLAEQEGAPSRLTAEQIETMDLRRLELVVLAACETQRAGSGRSGGFAGLSGAMLRAGARGVVGSLWRVEDRATSALVGEFYHAYGAGADAASALRQAQLRLLASPDPALRSPAAWSGFRYAGG
ncbi:CHAT domain-containing protein [Longimicrobium sp.]|uniref:CHAT domain-containing protein n=1 Tax=Longimicrobium sp. TaxID=2029185 RepID=UPI003B3ADCFD